MKLLEAKLVNLLMFFKDRETKTRVVFIFNFEEISQFSFFIADFD